MFAGVKRDLVVLFAIHTADMIRIVLIDCSFLFRGRSSYGICTVTGEFTSACAGLWVDERPGA